MIYKKNRLKINYSIQLLFLTYIQNSDWNNIEKSNSIYS